VFKGLSQPIIGTFSINLGQMMLDLIAEREEELGKLEEVSKELENYI
jgi:hypothetical protein